MRHFILPSPVLRHACGVLATAAKRPLIAPASLSLLDPARLPATATGAVNLAPVAPAADQSLTQTTGAAKEA